MYYRQVNVPMLSSLLMKSISSLFHQWKSQEKRILPFGPHIITESISDAHKSHGIITDHMVATSMHGLRNSNLLCGSSSQVMQRARPLLGAVGWRMKQVYFIHCRWTLAESSIVTNVIVNTGLNGQLMHVHVTAMCCAFCASIRLIWQGKSTGSANSPSTLL